MTLGHEHEHVRRGYISTPKYTCIIEFIKLRVVHERWGLSVLEEIQRLRNYRLKSRINVR